MNEWEKLVREAAEYAKTNNCEVFVSMANSDGTFNDAQLTETGYQVYNGENCQKITHDENVEIAKLMEYVFWTLPAKSESKDL